MVHTQNKGFFQRTASGAFETEHQKEQSFKYKVLSASYGNIVFAIICNPEMMQEMLCVGKEMY